MILIGQYDSPFVRRVGIALTLYGLPFEHRPWSTFGDADRIRPYNPLCRVPTLVLDDGTALVESHLMLDHLDHLVGPGRAMFPAAEPARHKALRIAGLATGLAEKSVSLFYEKRLHSEVSQVWVERCRSQIAAVLDVLEADRVARPGPWWFGERLGHADIAVACALRFLNDAHGGLVDMAGYPRLAAHAAALEATPAFQAISQVFIPPS
ncbi:MAG: glutathione S-transferase family protein [Geminicoccaceae bacterium]